jgi:TonB family protein
MDSWWDEHNAYAADVLRARPFAHRGLTAASANERAAYADTLDAEQEDISEQMDLFHASTAGGRRGDGRGGELGPDPTGSGGERGRGSEARALGTGDGAGVAVDPLDRRRRIYRRQVWAKIHGAWSPSAFPKEAVLEGKQGYTIVAFTILANGTVSGAHVSRSSGFPSFDAHMVAAVLRSAPFGPLPEGLGPALGMHHEFIVKNPAVR